MSIPSIPGYSSLLNRPPGRVPTSRRLGLKLGQSRLRSRGRDWVSLQTGETTIGSTTSFILTSRVGGCREFSIAYGK